MRHLKNLLAFKLRYCYVIVFLTGIDCIKNVRIRSFSGPYIPAFGLYRRDTEYLVFSPNAGKKGPEKLRLQTLVVIEIRSNMDRK